MKWTLGSSKVAMVPHLTQNDGSGHKSSRENSMHPSAYLAANSSTISVWPLESGAHFYPKNLMKSLLMFRKHPIRPNFYLHKKQFET